MASITQAAFRIRARNHVYDGLTKNKEGVWNGPFFFIQGADTQFGMIESFLEKKAEPRWDKEIELSQTAVAKINKMQPRPKFFVICGDLLDAWPETQAETRAAQEIDFKKVFAELHPDIPLVCVCGNHDVGNVPTKSAVAKYRTSFGDEYFSFWAGGVFCIVINSSYYIADVSQVLELVDEQDRWLDEQLAIASEAKHAIVFQHIPWFLREPDESWNPYFTIDLPLRRKMLDKFKAAGIKTVFCGHYHGNAGGFDGDLEVVVTSAIGAQMHGDVHGVRIVKVTEQAIQHEYVPLEKIPEKVHFK